MADPPLFPPQTNLSFFVAENNSNPIIPDVFYSTHFLGENELMKLKLTSDAFDRTWEVQLNGRRFAGGWEDFSAAHSLKDDDVLIFRHHGEMIFHVTPSGRCFSRIQCISSSSDDTEDDDDDSEDDEEEEEETKDNGLDSKNISSKKKSRLKAESSSSESSCLLPVTPSNLRLNRVSLTRRFARTNGLNKRCCEIDLMNQRGKSWVLGLRHNNSTGQDYIRGGWRSFCRVNELKTGSSYRFKLVRNGTRPLLQMCSHIKANGKAKEVVAKSSREGESASMKQNRFLTVTLKPYMFKSRQLRLPKHFLRENGIEKAGAITLVDKDGVKWPSYVASSDRKGELYYMTKGWISFCAANGIKAGETFVLQFVRGEGTAPMLKFCSKAKAKVKIVQAPSDGTRETGQASRDDDEEEEAHRDTEIRLRKRARASVEGGPSRRTHASNKSTADPKKEPLQPCSISDQVAKVKQSIVDILIDVRRFRSDLETKEQNLEASLQEINVLGEKVGEINKIFK